MARRRKRKLKIKNIIVFIVILLAIIIGGAMIVKGFLDKQKPIKKSDKIESNITSNTIDKVVEKEYISIKIGDKVPSILDYISSMDDKTEI